MLEYSGVGGCGIISGSASTDNKGNTYSVAGLMSTKFPVNVLLMELSEQLDMRRSWLRVDWTPREQNHLADALTNYEYHDFDPDKRIVIDPSTVKWIVLDAMIEAGGGMAEELSNLKEKRRQEKKEHKEHKRRRKAKKAEALKQRDPW